MVSQNEIRRHFPALQGSLVYLDSAASTQKPQQVIQAMSASYENGVANPNRGIYPLAEQMTSALEDARRTVATFINAKSHEIIFTKGATESINLVARTVGESLSAGDRIVLTVMEHHSNIVPWQQLAECRKVEIDWIDVDSDGQPNIEKLTQVLRKGRIKLVAITGLSNVLGSAPDVKAICSLAHENGALVLIDAAQMVAHLPIDVQAIDCDFLVFSAHKIYGPMGTGVLYGKEKVLDALPPFLGGGDMVHSVTKTGFTAAEFPRKFEAGTVSAVDIIGLGAALQWFSSYGMGAVQAHDARLMVHALSALQSVSGIRILGSQMPEKRTAVISFVVEKIHPHDLTAILGEKNICLRAGHHCAEPLHEALGVHASARMSFGVYNSIEDIDLCVATLHEAIRVLATH